MPDAVARTCAQCAAPLAPGRRFCLNCQAPVPGAAAGGVAGLAREIPSTRRPDRTLVFVPERREARLAREIPSTRRPDRTLVFVPERREARLARGRRRRRLLGAAAVALLLVSAAGFALWRARVREQAEAQVRRREQLAEGELGRFARSLELFHADLGRYPTSGEGLAALLRRPEQAADWRGPYIEGDYALDPWGNDYVYRAVNEGRGYELFTYGPEGEAAGRPLLRVHADP